MIEHLEQQILEEIDQMVESASDDELFAGGYLRGHLTLAVAKLNDKQALQPSNLDQQVQQSVQQAITAGELSPADQCLVLSLWQQLYQKAINQQQFNYDHRDTGMI